MKGLKKIRSFGVISLALLFTTSFLIAHPEAGQIVDESSNVDSGGSLNTSQTSNSGAASGSAGIGAGGSYSSSDNSGRSSKQVMKESANTAIGSLIQAIVESISQSIRNSNNQGSGQATKPSDSSGSVQPQNTEPPASEGRRPKPSRW